MWEINSRRNNKTHTSSKFIGLTWSVMNSQLKDKGILII